MSNPWSRWLQVNDTQLFQLSRKAGWDAFVNAAPRADFVTLTLEEMARLGPEEAEDYAEARSVWNANPPTVRTAQLTAAYEVLSRSPPPSDASSGTLVSPPEASAALSETGVQRL